MTQEPSATGGGDPEVQSLDEALHALKNCLSGANSGCLLIDDALDRGETEEIRELVAEMRDAMARAFTLTRAFPGLMARELEP